MEEEIKESKMKKVCEELKLFDFIENSVNILLNKNDFLFNNI